MKFLVLYLLAFIGKNTKKIVTPFKKLNTIPLDNEFPIKKTLQNVTGNDERFANNNLTDINIIEKNKYKLLEIFEKKKLLDILENDKVSIPIKLSLVKDNSIRGFTLTAGLKNEDYDFIL
jgi:hypothetical protein